MGWEQRFREMLLAGGALAATACGASTATQADAASSETPDAASSGGDGQSGDDAYTGTSFPCCNADPDPCCPMVCSGDVGPDAASYVDCEQNRTQCESMNGDYQPQPDGTLGCTQADAHD
jgi:hypothetical protein